MAKVEFIGPLDFRRFIGEITEKWSNRLTARDTSTFR
jgi:hypothetical protein